VSIRIEDLEPDTQARCRELLARYPGLIVVSTLRTFEEQAAIYAKGRTRPGPIVTNAKPGYSWHNFGRAFDVAFRTPTGGVKFSGPWQSVGKIARELGLICGMDWVKFPDKGHFEYQGGHTLAELRAALNPPPVPA